MEHAFIGKSEVFELFSYLHHVYLQKQEDLENLMSIDLAVKKNNNNKTTQQQKTTRYMDMNKIMTMILPNKVCI
jgi:hypothetical protein